MMKAPDGTFTEWHLRQEDVPNGEYWEFKKNFEYPEDTITINIKDARDGYQKPYTTHPRFSLDAARKQWNILIGQGYSVVMRVV